MTCEDCGSWARQYDYMVDEVVKLEKRLGGAVDIIQLSAESNCYCTDDCPSKCPPCKAQAWLVSQGLK